MIRVRRLETLSAREQARLIDRGSVTLGPAMDAARRIVEQVRKNGDGALRALTRRFDRVDRRSPEVAPAEWRAAGDRVPAPVRAALKRAGARIRAFHRLSLPHPVRLRGPGSVLGRRPVAYDRVGVYVPGGSAAYPSTVLMAVIPARLAGVGEVLLATPPGPDGLPPDAVLAAAAIAGVDRVFAVGGAQAIAALAFGTRTVPAVDKIVGPGNAFVTAAKLIVQGRVAIDNPAGPSEVLVLSDGSGDPRFLAADMLAQAEHSPDASAVLVTTSPVQAEAVARALADGAASLPRRAIIERALRACGAILVATRLEDAIEFANRYAAEHLTIMTRRPEATLGRIRHAGSVFLGTHAPVAIGDYCSGTNHVLPTAGAARFYSGLSTADFVRHQTWQRFTPAGLRGIARVAVTLARVEGLEAHARSLEVRAEGR